MTSMKAKQKQKTTMNVRQDLVAVEDKVDIILETINDVRQEMRTQTTMLSQLPTKEEITSLLNLNQKINRISDIIRQKLHVEV
jgi:Tfp pilus assembly protein PilO